MESSLSLRAYVLDKFRFSVLLGLLSTLGHAHTWVHAEESGFKTGINGGTRRYGTDDPRSVFTMAVNVTDLSCGRSNLCRSTLGHMEYPASCFRCRPCRCDDQCYQHGDCCNDEMIQVINSLKSIPNYVTCIAKLEHNIIRGRVPQHTGVLQVSKCPISASSSNLHTTVQQCEHPNLDTLLEALPVWSPSTGLNYRNKFCAICHEELDYKFWNVSAKCNISSAFSELKSREKMWEVAWRSKYCAFTSSPPMENIARQCHLGKMVDSCEISGSNSSESRTIARLCKQVTNPVQFNRTLYKNVFCALCNGVSLNRSQICKIPEVHSRIPPVPPLSVLLNFYPHHSDESLANIQEDSTCPSNRIYSHLLGGCSRVICPPRRLYTGTECQPVFQSCAGLGYRLSFTLLPDRPVDLPSTGYLIRRYERQLRRQLKRFQPFVFTPLTMTVTGQRFYKPVKIVRVQSMKVSLQFVSSSTESLDDLELGLRGILRQPWTLLKDDINVTFMSIPSEGDSLIDRGKVLASVAKNDSRILFGKKCLKQNCLRLVEFLEFSDFLTCPSLKLTADHYRGNLSLRNMSLLIGNESFLLKDDMFRDMGDEIQLCVSELNRITPSSEPLPENDNSWKATFSTLCLTVSDVCLLLTFIIYCCFPSLRTLPGKNTMALVFHLFWAQFVYLCGVNATANVVLCQVLGVIIHYMWLSSFFWMFICAYHMYIIFSNLLSNSNCVSKERSDRRLFLHYCLFANLAPLVLVIACIGYFLGRTGGQEIGYGGKLCFLNSMGATGIFFASPLLLILIFNFFFFIRTVLSIRRTPDVLSHNCTNRNYAAIYFRLSLLLGFGWVFGFFPSITVIFCLFSVFTGGQGVFIFVSFCLNSRVLILLSQKFQCSRCHLFTSVASSTKSTETQ